MSGAVPDHTPDRATIADVIAETLMCDLDEFVGQAPDATDRHDAARVLDALDAAGFRVVPAGHVVIDPADIPSDLVEILSTVTLRGDDADDPEAYAALRAAARLLTPETP